MERMRPQKTKHKKNKVLSVRQLKVKLDAIFSRFIRERDNWTCFTCGAKAPEVVIQCGHFISRAHNSTRYDPENCVAQCVKCNIFLAGNHGEFAIRLMEKLGQEGFRALVEKSRQTKQFTPHELKKIIELYEERTRKM